MQPRHLYNNSNGHQLVNMINLTLNKYNLIEADKHRLQEITLQLLMRIGNLIIP